MGLIFLFWLVLSSVCDALFRKSFNWNAMLGGFVAIISIIFYPNSHPVNISILDSLLGAVAAFFVLFVFYKMKMMGAGDVKFSSALGFWVGWKLLLPIWALSCIFAIIHGAFARSALKYFFVMTSSIKDGTSGSKKFVPYVTYLSLATILVIGYHKSQ